MHARTHAKNLLIILTSIQCEILAHIHSTACNFDMFLTRMMQGILLVFRPPAVHHLRYCAAEEITNYTQLH